MNKIYCEPINGLGNRLMFMLSAFRLSVKYKKKLVFIWNPDKDMDCNFYEIFSKNFEFQNHKPNLPAEESLVPYRYVVDLNYDRDLYLKGFHFIFTPNDFFLSKEELTIEYIKFWNKFLFSDSIQALRKNIFYDLGIHIRRSSILDTRDWGMPDVDTVLRLIMHVTEIKNNEVKNIYISSNNPIELDYLADSLSEKFNIYKSSAFNFSNEISAIKSSFVDLFSLLNCEIMFRRDTSTFSSFPSMLNSSKEYLYTEDGKLIHRNPLILSGLAL